MCIIRGIMCIATCRRMLLSIAMCIVTAKESEPAGYASPSHNPSAVAIGAPLEFSYTYNDSSGMCVSVPIRVPLRRCIAAIGVIWI